MFRHKILVILVLIATCWHVQEFGAFRAAARTFGARATKKATAKAAVAGAALYGGYQASNNLSVTHTPNLTKRDIIRNIIENNDIAQLKKMGPSLLPIDITRAFEQLIFNQGSLEAIAALIPYARQEELHDAFTSSAYAKRKDILEYMINSGIKIDDDTKDFALSRAIDKKASDIIDLLYPLAPKTNNALSAAAEIGDLALVKKMAVHADDFDTALCATIRSFSTYIIRRKSLDEYHKIVDFLSNQPNNSFKNALAAACKYKDKTTFTHLLPKCSDISLALIQSITNDDLSYARLILAQHKDAIPSDLLDTMVLEAVRFNDNSAEREELINQYLPKVTDPFALTAIFRIHPGKQQLFSDKQLKSIKFFASFRGDNWVEKLLSNNGPEKDSVTAMLLRKYKTHTDDSTLTKFCENTNLERLPLIGFVPKLDCAVSQIAEIEHDDQKNDYTTFVHGRDWQWNFVNDVWSIITALKDKKEKIPSTIAMRQRDIDCDTSQLYTYRKKLIQDGVIGDHLVSCTNDPLNNDRKEREEVTFMNYTGLSHLDCLPECSMRYFLQNHSASGGDAGYTWAQKLIAQHGLSAYQSDFDALYKAHQASNRHGEMLTISVANKHLDTIVYPAKIGGYRINGPASETVAALKQQIHESGNIATMKSGTPIFCAAALNIPGENETMYKIRSVNLADRAKYQQYLQQRDALFEKLKNEVRYERSDAAATDHQKFMSAFTD